MQVAPRGVEGSFVAAGATNGNGEVVGRFHDKMDNLKKKRKKLPLMSGEVRCLGCVVVGCRLIPHKCVSRGAEF